MRGAGAETETRNELSARCVDRVLEMTSVTGRGTGSGRKSASGRGRRAWRGSGRQEAARGSRPRSEVRQRWHRVPCVSRPRSNGISTPNMETATGPAISALCSAATGRVGGNSTPLLPQRERECCLLVLSLVSSTLPCIRQPRPRLRVLDICGFVLVCTQAFMGFLGL